MDEPLAMARDVNGNGRFEENELFFYTKDHLNSVHDLTDFEGKLVQRYNYTAYGETKIEKTVGEYEKKLVENPFAYTSREWSHETGDYHYRARDYDPMTGRFLSEDPIGFRGGDFNLYRYVLNNPIKYNDPTGKFVGSPAVSWVIKRIISSVINKQCSDGPIANDDDEVKKCMTKPRKEKKTKRINAE